MNILFLCKGNICRSPAAEAYLRMKRPHWNIASAATTPNTGGQKTDPRMVKACKAKGIKIRAKTVVNVKDVDKSIHYGIIDLHKEGLEDPYITGNFDGALEAIIDFIDRNLLSAL